METQGEEESIIKGQGGDAERRFPKSKNQRKKRYLKRKNNIVAQYRLLEITNNLSSDKKPYWMIQKKILGLWWSEYFQECTEWGGIYYDKEEATRWYKYYTGLLPSLDIKIIAQNKV